LLLALGDFVDKSRTDHDCVGGPRNLARGLGFAHAEADRDG
jgi:hypothetical protein